ncbi:ABC transporter permease [Streptomyces sp. NPDC020096]
MSSIAPTQAPAPAAERPARPAYKVTGSRVLRSEWAKLWSLRSSWISLGLALLFLAALGVVGALDYRSGIASGRHIADVVDALSLSLFGTNVAQVVIGVLGVLLTAGEYATGMIRSTLAAVPRRLPVLWSKATVLGLIAFALATVGAFIAFLSANSIVSGTPAALPLSATGVVRSLLGAGLYLGLVGVIGVALGALLRSVAGGVSVLVVLLTLTPILLSMLAGQWAATIARYLPSRAGEAMFTLHHDASTLSPAAGLMVLLLWTAVALAGAAVRLARTDA